MKETIAASPSKNITASSSVFAPQRVASVDVYRGFVMLLMMGEVLSLRLNAGPRSSIREMRVALR